MSERYWEAGFPPAKLVEELSAWVNENVCEAVGSSWEREEENPIGWIKNENGELIISATGPERVDNEKDIYEIKLSLIACLAEYGKNYSDDDEDDRKERALMLRDLAKKVLEFAENLE